MRCVSLWQRTRRQGAAENTVNSCKAAANAVNTELFGVACANDGCGINSVRVRRKRFSVPTVCRPRRWPVAGRHLTAGSFWEVSVDALMLSACIPTQPVSFSLILSCAQFVGKFVLCVKFNIQPCACLVCLVCEDHSDCRDKRPTCCDYYSLNISTFQKCLETKMMVNCASSREMSTAIKAS